MSKKILPSSSSLLVYDSAYCSSAVLPQMISVMPAKFKGKDLVTGLNEGRTWPGYIVCYNDNEQTYRIQFFPGCDTLSRTVDISARLLEPLTEDGLAQMFENAVIHDHDDILEALNSALRYMRAPAVRFRVVPGSIRRTSENTSKRTEIRVQPLLTAQGEMPRQTSTPVEMPPQRPATDAATVRSGTNEFCVTAATRGSICELQCCYVHHTEKGASSTGRLRSSKSVQSIGIHTRRVRQSHNTISKNDN